MSMKRKQSPYEHEHGYDGPSNPGGHRGFPIWWLDLQLPVQSVPISPKVVSLNPVHGEVYLIQHYVIKFVSNLRQVSGLLRFPPQMTTTNQATNAQTHKMNLKAKIKDRKKD